VFIISNTENSGKCLLKNGPEGLNMLDFAENYGVGVWSARHKTGRSAGQFLLKTV
jgi:hypothetical protein